MKQKIILFSFSILLLLFFTNSGFTKQLEKDEVIKKRPIKIEKKEQTEALEKNNAVVSDDQTSVMSVDQMLLKKPKSAASTMAGEQINWLVLSSGGVRGTSTDLVLTNTVGQATVNIGTSTDLQLNLGFWQDFTTVLQDCCLGIRGNVDNSPDDVIDIADLVYLASYMFRSGPAPICFDEANVTGDDDDLDIAELVYLVDYMFRGGPVPLDCP